MNDFSRRDFMGGMLGISSILGLSETTIADLVVQSEPLKKPTEYDLSNATPALKRIIQQITEWNQEGQKFKDDQLEANNDAQWNKLLLNYFDRNKCTSISVNSANLCPSLKQVNQMVHLVEQMLDEDISFPMRGDLAKASLGYGLGYIKNWIGNNSECTPESLIALTRNTTEGNNFINNGLVTSGFFNPQEDNIVVWDVNHPTNYDAWLYRQATQKWPKKCIKKLQTKMFSQTLNTGEKQMGMIPSDPQSENDIIDALKYLLDDKTKIVSLSWQSNECGMLLPMKRIVEVVRLFNKDIHIHADSAQTFGVLDLKLGKEIDVDSIAGSFHKWPCGPKMVGLLYMKNAKAAKNFIPSIWGYDEYIKTPKDYGYDPEEGKIDPSAKRFSYLGQQNDATLVSTWIAALFHTGFFHPNVSPAKIEARIRYLGDQAKEALYKNLPRIFPEFSPETAYQYIATPTTNKQFRTSVFLFKVPDGIQAGDVMTHVYEKYKFAIANLAVKGNDLLRISPTISNTSCDVHNVVDYIVDVIREMQKGNLPKKNHRRSYS